MSAASGTVPRLIRLSDGRQLACAELGDPAGRPVIVFHGLPGSRLQQHPDPGIARGLGLRLIHFDRPGFGLSAPRPRRSLPQAAADVAELADRLGIREFAVAGVSGGTPPGLACTALLGTRVLRTAIISGLGPPGSIGGAAVNPGARVGYFLAHRASWVMKFPLQAAAAMARRNPQRYLDSIATALSPPDRRILGRPEVRAVMAADVVEAFRQGAAAMIEDLSLATREWGLPLGTIRTPVSFWHGMEDWVVPDGAARHLAAAIPGAALHLLPGEGHFVIFEIWPQIAAWLAGPAAGAA